MAAIFLSNRGMAQSEREAIGPRRVLPHVGFAVLGFGFWVAYAITEADALGWVAMAALAVAFFIAGTFLLTRDQHRRADLARARAASLGPIAGGAGSATEPGAAVPARPRSPSERGSQQRTVPAEYFIPIPVASLHGLLGGATLVLVLLERAGVS